MRGAAVASKPTASSISFAPIAATETEATAATRTPCHPLATPAHSVLSEDLAAQTEGIQSRERGGRIRLPGGPFCIWRDDEKARRHDTYLLRGVPLYAPLVRNRGGCKRPGRKEGWSEPWGRTLRSPSAAVNNEPCEPGAGALPAPRRVPTLSCRRTVAPNQRPPTLATTWVNPNLSSSVPFDYVQTSFMIALRLF